MILFRGRAITTVLREADLSDPHVRLVLSYEALAGGEHPVIEFLTSDPELGVHRSVAVAAANAFYGGYAHRSPDLRLSLMTSPPTPSILRRCQSRTNDW